MPIPSLPRAGPSCGCRLAPGIASDPDGAVTRRLAEDMTFMATADGTSLAAYEAPLRAAAASVRAMLAKAAAARWDVDWEACGRRVTAPSSMAGAA